MKTQETINGITYNIIGEIEMTGKMAEQGFYKTMLILVRPKGHIQFWAMRDINGVVTLN
jgi:hypothetical protein